jgi:hypothetical protein
VCRILIPKKKVIELKRFTALSTRVCRILIPFALLVKKCFIIQEVIINQGVQDFCTINDAIKKDIK